MNEGLKELFVDEVIMGNVLQAGQGQNTRPPGHDRSRSSPLHTGHDHQ